MKTLQITAPGKPEWLDVPIPAPAEGEALVKILYVTTCPHWDLHIMDGIPMFPGGQLIYPYAPGQPGHEAFGEVIALGSSVSSPAVGSRVAFWRDAGQDRPGCYAQYNCASTEILLELPPDLPDEAATSVELAMCVQVSFDQLEAVNAVRNARFAIGGLGPAGLVAVQMADAYGAKEVIGIDPLLGRRILAELLGAQDTITPDADALTPGRFSDQAYDTSLDCTGLKTSIEFLMDRTKDAVAIFGVLRDEVVFTTRHWARGLSLLGYRSHNLAAARKALRLIADGKLDLKPLSTHTLPLNRYAEGVDLLRTKEAIKVRFLPWA